MKIKILCLVTLIFTVECRKNTPVEEPLNTSIPGFKENMKLIVFLGNSITQLGEQPGGYIDLLNTYIQQSNLDTAYFLLGKGIGGNKVADLWNRVDKDVIVYNPDIVFIYIGINDVWHHTKAQVLAQQEKFRTLLTGVVNKIKSSSKDTKVVLCTLSVIGERRNKRNLKDQELDLYSSIVRDVADATSSELCDLRSIFTDRIQVENIQDEEFGIFTKDGVHLTDKGNKLVADAMFPFIKP